MYIYVVNIICYPCSQELKSFNLRPTTVCPVRVDSRGAGRDDTLSSLPYEVLCHVASFLDSMSLSQLALVSRLMRQVCSSQLQDKGIVTLRWQKKTYSRGKTKWRAKPVSYTLTVTFKLS